MTHSLMAFVVTLLSLFSAVAVAGNVDNRGETAAATAAADDASVVPALLTNIWTGFLNGAKGSLTFYGNSNEDIASQIRRYDPSYDTSDMSSEVSFFAYDNGTPEDLPDIGDAPIIWRGPGGPWDDYSNGTITYNYTCGLEATANENRSRDGAYKLRNMGTKTAFTAANSCARQWCWDTTAMFVCNDMDTDLTIPMYNVGKMAYNIDRLCCVDDHGKSGRMWHYKLNYSVVLGYANCRTDPTTNSPYPQGEGNNGWCEDAGTIIYNPPM